MNFVTLEHAFNGEIVIVNIDLIVSLTDLHAASLELPSGANPRDFTLISHVGGSATAVRGSRSRVMQRIEVAEWYARNQGSVAAGTEGG